MDGVMVIETEKAIVRIHPGKLTDEERKVVLEKAVREFCNRIQKTPEGRKFLDRICTTV